MKEVNEITHKSKTHAVKQKASHANFQHLIHKKIYLREVCLLKLLGTGAACCSPS